MDRSTLPLVGCLVLAAIGCSDDESAAIIAVQSDLDGVTRVEVEIRDDDDSSFLDRFSFDSAEEPRHKLPFSFRLEPRKLSNQRVVVKATGFAGDAFLSEVKLRVPLAEGSVIRRTLTLRAACREVRCDDGESCDPSARTCAPIPDEPPSSTADAGDDAGTEGGSGEGVSGTSGGPGGEAGSAAGGGGRSGTASGSGGASAADGGGGGTSAGGAAGAGVGGASGAGAGAGGAGGASGMGAGGTSGAGTGGASGSGSGGTVGSAADGGRGVLTDPHEKADVTYQGRGYVLQNNVYMPNASQTLTYDSTSFTLTRVSGGDPYGISFPAAYVGSNWGWESKDTNLPLRVGDLQSVEVRFTSNLGEPDGAYHSLSLLAFSFNSSGDDQNPSGGTVEVWYHIEEPHLPLGTELVAASVSIAGASWDVYKGSCFERPCVFYLPKVSQRDFSGDLLPFIREAQTLPGALSPDWYLTTVSTGVDVQMGGAGIEMRNISMNVR